MDELARMRIAMCFRSHMQATQTMFDYQMVTGFLKLILPKLNLFANWARSLYGGANLHDWRTRFFFLKLIIW